MDSASVWFTCLSVTVDAFPVSSLWNRMAATAFMASSSTVSMASGTDVTASDSASAVCFGSSASVTSSVLVASAETASSYVASACISGAALASPSDASGAAFCWSVAFILANKASARAESGSSGKASSAVSTG